MTTTRFPRHMRQLAAALGLALGAGALLPALAAPGEQRVAQGPGPGPMGHGPGGAMGGPGGPMFGGMLKRMLERVNATPEQRAQVDQIMKSAGADLRAQRDAGRALREQTMALFAQPTVDAAAAEALRQKQLALHDAASKRMMDAMIQVSRVLTPEQRKQMAEYMQQRRDMMERQMRERQSLDGPPRG